MFIVFCKEVDPYRVTIYRTAGFVILRIFYTYSFFCIPQGMPWVYMMDLFFIHAGLPQESSCAQGMPCAYIMDLFFIHVGLPQESSYAQGMPCAYMMDLFFINYRNIEKRFALPR